MEFVGALLLGHSRLAYILSPLQGNLFRQSCEGNIRSTVIVSVAEPQSVNVGELYAKLLCCFQILDLPLYASTCTLQLTPFGILCIVSPPREVALQPICLPSFQRLMESRITTLASVRTGLVTGPCRAVAQARRPVPKFELPYYPP